MPYWNNTDVPYWNNTEPTGTHYPHSQRISSEYIRDEHVWPDTATKSRMVTGGSAHLSLWINILLSLIIMLIIRLSLIIVDVII